MLNPKSRTAESWFTIFDKWTPRSWKLKLKVGRYHREEAKEGYNGREFEHIGLLWCPFR